MSISAVLGGHRILPVVALDDPARADDLGMALAAGGLPVAEVTLRSPRAVEVLATLADRGDLVVGAGSVVRADQVDEVHDAGARFVVSPGLSEAVLRRGRQLGVPVVPGVATASELMRALDLGVEVVKFFPAEAGGGLPAIQALAGPFGDVGFVPTGGIDAAGAARYLAHPSVVAVGGSWMVAPDLLADRRWHEVADRCAAAVASPAGAGP